MVRKSKFAPAFKAKVALGAHKNEKTLIVLAKEFNVSLYFNEAWLYVFVCYYRCVQPIRSWLETQQQLERP